MTESHDWLLQHSRSTAVEGRRVMLGTVGTCIGLGLLLAVIIPKLWGDSHGIVLIAYGLLVVIAIAGVTFGVQNIRSNETFYCRLSKVRLDCHSPVPGCGESFSIMITEISKIEEDPSGGEGGPSSWYIVDSCSRRYKLPTNYGNPAERFVEIIRELIRPPR